MAWDNRGYYYRSVRENGRVRRRYLGNGPLAQRTAQEVEARRRHREAQKFELATLRNRLEQPSLLADQQRKMTTELVHAALVAAGFHRVDRHWRLRRARCPETNA